MRFGFCAPIEQIDLISAAGYDYIEPPLAPTLTPERPLDPSVVTGVAAKSIAPEAFNIFLPGDLKVVGPEIDPVRQAGYLESAFERVAGIGGKIVVFGSGGSRRIPDGFSRPEAESQIAEFLRLAVPIAEKRGVTIAIEPLNTGECNFINSVAEALEIARKIGSPAVRVLSDLYHVDKEGQTYDETSAAGASLAHVHVAGAENRRVPNSDDLDYLTRYFAALKQIGYSGRISVEGSSDNISRDAPIALDIMRRAWLIA